MKPSVNSDDTLIVPDQAIGKKQVPSRVFYWPTAPGDTNVGLGPLSSKLRGHYQYFGVRGNMRAMAAVRDQVRRAWRYWLHRRSSKKAMPWEKFTALLERMPLPTPKILHTV